MLAVAVLDEVGLAVGVGDGLGLGDGARVGISPAISASQMSWVTTPVFGIPRPAW